MSSIAESYLFRDNKNGTERKISTKTKWHQYQFKIMARKNQENISWHRDTKKYVSFATVEVAKWQTNKIDSFVNARAPESAEYKTSSREENSQFYCS